MATKRKEKVTGDPLDLNGRLYRQLGRLLDDMEAADRDDRMTMPQRIQALIAVGRVQKMFQDLRKGDMNAGAGTTVAKYAAAFKTTDAVGRGSNNAGPSNIIEFDRAEPGDPDYDAD